MSGGAFNYKQYEFREIADKIERTLQQEFVNTYSKEVLDKIKETIKVCKQAETMVQRVDWLFCGDDGQETFLKRLDEELKKLEQE